MKLKTKRIDLGMTLERMAEKLGITIVTYRTWEMNPRKITVENAKKICLILRCKLEEVDEWK